MCPVELSQEQAIEVFNALRAQPTVEHVLKDLPNISDKSPRHLSKASAFLRVLANSLEGTE